MRVLARQDHFVLVARASLLLLIVNLNEQTWAFVTAALATAVLFLRTDWLRLPFPWLALALMAGIAQWNEWWVVDDHTVVTTYWMLGIGLSRLATDPRRVLATTARLLVGLVFAFAFGWKLLSSQYTSTDFFRYTLIVDDRFHHVAEYVGQTNSSLIAQTDESIDDLYATGDVGDQRSLQESEYNDDVAAVFTWWGLLIEGLIAAAFLLPLPAKLRWLRPTALLTFAYTTYAIVPVAGFGALLMVLGLAQRDTPRLRTVYAVSFGVLLVWGGVFTLLV